MKFKILLFGGLLLMTHSMWAMGEASEQMDIDKVSNVCGLSGDIWILIFNFCIPRVEDIQPFEDDDFQSPDALVKALDSRIGDCERIKALTFIGSVCSGFYALLAKKITLASMFQMKLRLDDIELGNFVDSDENTVLHLAIDSYKKEVIKFLLAVAGDRKPQLLLALDDCGSTVVHDAMYRRDQKIAKIVLDAFDGDSLLGVIMLQDNDEDTPLHDAVAVDFVQGAKMLLGHAGSKKQQLLEKKNAYGQTAYHQAVNEENNAIADFLKNIHEALITCNHERVQELLKMEEEEINEDQSITS